MWKDRGSTKNTNQNYEVKHRPASHTSSCSLAEGGWGFMNLLSILWDWGSEILWAWSK